MKGETKEQQADRKMREEITKLDNDRPAAPAACRELLDLSPTDDLKGLFTRLHLALDKWDASEQNAIDDTYAMRAINAAARLIPGMRK